MQEIVVYYFGICHWCWIDFKKWF